MNLNVGIEGKSYTIGGTSQILSGTSMFSGFSQSTLTISSLNRTGCLTGCNAEVQGFFAGTSAERAGLGYRIQDAAVSKDILGAAAFQKK